MYYYGRDKKRRDKKRLKRSLIALALASFFAVSYLLFFNGNSTDHLATVDPVENSLQARRILAGNRHPVGQNGFNPKDEMTVDARKEGYEEAIIPKKDKSTVFEKKEEKKVTAQVNPDAKHLGSLYDVRSVAHFYSKPSERARRKEAINYWNHSYASIKPMNEKNGFIYVEFKYPLGQTTRGWLRKKDLRRVNTVYGNNKD
jgi:hypothetical protein